MKNISNRFIILLFTIILFSCEDEAPTDYLKSYVVQALLLVNEPIHNIQVLQSGSLRDSFIVDNSFIQNAEVQITGDDKVFNLSFDPKTKTYFFSDTTYKVKEQKKYDIKIKLDNGNIITGSTFTPKSFNWIEKPGEKIQYPLDTLALPSTFKVSWTKTDTIKFYLLSIVALDTLNYGSYLEPSTDELNRRILRPWNENRDNYFRDRSNWGYAQLNELPVVWNFFKWFGMQEMTIYAPDDNYLLWSLQVLSFREFNPELTSLKGAYGYFGSAAAIRAKSFLIKNQK